MMEAPSSPPEQTQTPSGGVSFTSQALNSSQPSAQLFVHQASTSRTNGDSTAKVNHGPPGSAWSSKKFNDEYDRTVHSLLDQNWDHSAYWSYVNSGLDH